MTKSNRCGGGTAATPWAADRLYLPLHTLSDPSTATGVDASGHLAVAKVDAQVRWEAKILKFSVSRSGAAAVPLSGKALFPLYLREFESSLSQ